MRAVKRGGVIRFRCGPDPVTIVMKATAKVVNTSKRVVIDGEGLVTLSGAGKRRILYQNTCDQKQIWTTSHCNDQATPRLVVQNLRMVRGNSTGKKYDGGGGGAIFARGGRLKIVNTTFVRNRCDRSGPDLGGAAVRVLDQFQDQPVYVVGSHFSKGRCSNGGALSSIGVSWAVFNSTFTDNSAVGHGANPARSGTQGRRLGRCDLQRRQPVPAVDRRVDDDRQPRQRRRRARSSSSATTAPGRCASGGRRCDAT